MLGPPGIAAALGSSIPPSTAHAISVSLPTWQDNVGYEEGEKRVVDAMVSGYPRFFIHLSIQKLASICEQKFGLAGEKCSLLPTKRIADQCRSFINHRWQQTSHSDSSLNVRLIHFVMFPEPDNGSPKTDSKPTLELHIVLFPQEAAPLAKQFWQHTGLGISSRLAERCLSMLSANEVPQHPPSPTTPTGKSVNRHYACSRSFSIAKCDPSFLPGPISSPPSSPGPRSPPTFDRDPGPRPTTTGEALGHDQTVYVEERYGRNLPLQLASNAKKMLRRRIAGVLVHDGPTTPVSADVADVQLGLSSRGVAGVTEDDVYLYPTGMAAIWSAHQLVLAIRPPAKSVCFGFTYTDTPKVLQKWGPGCHILGHGLDSDIDELEKILEAESTTTTNPPILALITEFPSNPLLRSANLPRLRALADKYDFLVIIDETVGNFVNVRVFPYADIIVSSLTKVFSGVANVMGGSLVLNPERRHYHALKEHMSVTYEDVYFDEDALFMERNSRDFRRRIAVIDTNTQAVCEFLRSRSLDGGGPASSVIKTVFYPKYITRENYEQCRITGGEDGEGGFGGLFSLTFVTSAASRAFFDAFPFHKGPSLGTDFTLACPYTILAHYMELDWAAQYGVEEGLVRISVGMEDVGVLLEGIERAVKAAETVDGQK